MKIKKIGLNNYGRFENSEMDLEFGKGLNVVFGKKMKLVNQHLETPYQSCFTDSNQKKQRSILITQTGI